MKAVVLRSANDLAVLDVPLPILKPGWALVRVTHCGICGSDIRYFRGDNPWAKQTLGRHIANPKNIILGHEITGIVAEIGPGVPDNLIGKRVAVLAFGTCGVCVHCRRGEEHLCERTQHLGHGAGWEDLDYYYGGMAEYVPVDHKWLVPLPDQVSNEAGALLDPLGVAVHAVRKTNIQDGDTILVVGGGAVGQLVIQVAKAIANAQVVLVDLCKPVLEVATRMGADAAFTPDLRELSESVMGLSGGYGCRAIIDTVGASLGDYLPLLARGGTYVIMTVTDELQKLHTISLAGERALVSSCNFRFSEYYEGLSLLQGCKIKPAPVITHRFHLSNAIEAFRTAENKSETGAVKVMLYT
ncbi:MAG: alcohol dehydrogenase catalytic domain-containing protein [Armatimonadota bacterium]|nr:alcohol dehydrogenase catalytic domain-containing protein [Armatimonadota bacterium]